MNQHIAIDGPASAGKSTIAKEVARRLGLVYVDTGAMYRAMAVHFLRCGLAPEDEAGITEACRDAQVSIEYKGGMQQVLLNGKNVTHLLRDEATGSMASSSSVYGEVRKKLVELQQELASRTTVVMDGRDIGTVVLPDAALKIYLTASAEERARRRYKELQAKGIVHQYEEIEQDIKERDARDMNRPIAPLRPAGDSVIIDCSAMSISKVVARILSLYEKVRS